MKTRISIAALACLATSLPALGQETDTGPWQRAAEQMFRREEPRVFTRYPEELLSFLEAGDGVFTKLNVTTVYQGASASRTSQDSLTNVAYDFSGGWSFIEVSDINDASISWWIRGGRPIGGASRDADLSENIGSILDVNATLESESIYLPELYWTHGVTQRFRYTIGRLDPSWRYDFNATANNDREDFLGLALNNSPTVPFPTSGLGADFLWELQANIDVHVGVYQTNCRKDSLCFSDLTSDEWFIPAEATIKTLLPGQGEGAVRLLVFASKKGNESGGGFSVSADQMFGRFVPFVRLGVSDPDVSVIERFFSIGLGIDQPLGRPYDRIGIGLGEGEPSDQSLREESFVEIFWRLRLNPFVSLTPNVQIIRDPANNPGEDRVTVAGLRFQLDF